MYQLRSLCRRASALILLSVIKRGSFYNRPKTR
jgi:hypothetical protein